MNEIFSALGFKDEEIKVYLALLQHGPGSAGDVSKKVGRPRPTVYAYLETLIAGGLVTRSMRRGVQIFVPQPLHHIDHLYERKIADFTAKKNSLEQIIPTIEKSINMDFTRPRIQFFEGKQEVENAQMDMLNYSGITVRVFWSNEAAIHAISDDFFWFYNKERIKRKIYLKGIWPYNQQVDTRRYPFMASGKDMLREVRQAPDTMVFSMSCRIYADKVIYFSSNLEGFCFIMESKEFAQSAASQHETIWRISKPVASDPAHAKRFLNSTDENDE